MTIVESQIRKEKGAASVELIVGCLAALPLFFGISLLGKYADMRHKTVEAANYIAWEKVIWQSGKSASDLELEATDRLMGHREAPIIASSTVATQGVTEDPLWRDRATRTLMVSDGSTIRVNVTSTSNAGGIAHSAGVRFAAERADLSVNGITAYRVTLPATNRARTPLSPTGLSSFFNVSHYSLPSALTFPATSGILVDSWNAENKDTYQNSVKKLTVEKILDIAVIPGTKTFGILFPFLEGKKGDDPDIVAPTESILSKYKASSG